MIRARAIAFWALTALLLAANLVLIADSFRIRFWEDEALNLTVPLNLLRGLGYASDGALSGSTITPFDPRISTGPVVLLPVVPLLATGMDMVTAARIVPLVYWLLLIGGLALLGWRLGGRWAALLGAAVPLAFDTTAGISPILGVGNLLGEIPAAALLVWALIALPRRAWLAGLLVGLAVQAKLIALLALPAFAVAIWIWAPGRGWARLGAAARRSLLPLVLAGVPTLLVEAGALIGLGPSGYLEHLRELKAFILGGGQGDAGTTVVQKIMTLLGDWYVPWWLALIAGALTVTVCVVGLTVTRPRRVLSSENEVPIPGEHDPSTPDDTHWRALLAYAAAALVGAAAFVGWWATASHLPLWVRHPSPGIFAFFPVLAIVAVACARLLLARAAAWRMPVAAALLVIATTVVLGVVGHAAWTQQPRSETLSTQRADAAAIEAWLEQTGTQWLAAQPWGWAVSPIVMSGAHVGLADAPTMGEAPWLTDLPCATETLLSTGRYLLCAAP